MRKQIAKLMEAEKARARLFPNVRRHQLTGRILRNEIFVGRVLKAGLDGSANLSYCRFGVTVPLPACSAATAGRLASPPAAPARRRREGHVYGTGTLVLPKLF